MTGETNNTFDRFQTYCLSLFCLSKKVTKKRPRELLHPIPGAALIKLRYYCDFNSGNLPAGRQVLLLGSDSLL